MTIEPFFPDGVSHTEPVDGADSGRVDGNLLWISAALGYGWCIDYGVEEPVDKVSQYEDLTANDAMQLTHVLNLVTKDNYLNPGTTELTGERRDVAIYLTKELVETYDSGDNDQAYKLSFALQFLLSSVLSGYNNLGTALHGGTAPVSIDELQDLTGYRYTSTDGLINTVEYRGTDSDGTPLNIPEAGENEYITVIVPEGYDITQNQAANAIGQRLIPPDQPGLEEEEPLSPEIGTQAAFKSGSEVKAGAVVTDRVSYSDLVAGKAYTLSGQLISKADGSTVLGSASKVFMPESAAGTVSLDITVDAGVEGVVSAAVVFETLTSTVVNAAGEDTPGVSDDEPNEIATHKDIDDEDQTVTSEEPEEPEPGETESPEPGQSPTPDDSETPGDNPTPDNSKTADDSPKDKDSKESKSSLAKTGASSMMLFPAAATLLALGIGALILRRRNAR